MDSADLSRGIALFNRSKFFEAHEALEDVWRTAPLEEKKFFQGLVQAAVAFHHFSTGNWTGMRSVMERAIRNLDGCPADFHGLNVAPLVHSMAQWRKAVESSQPLPPLPRIEMTDHEPQAI